MKKMVFFVIGLCWMLSSYSQTLNVVSFKASEKSGSINSYILTSGKQSILVNPPMSVPDTRRLIDTLARLNRHISGVLITEADPLYYLGTSEVKKAMPDIKILAAKEVADEIRISGNTKYNLFRTTLGTDMPPPLVLPDSIVENVITLENCRINLQSLHEGSEWISILYEPKQKLLFTGNIVSDKIHLKLADKLAETWIKELEALNSYTVTTLYPGCGEPTDGRIIESCISYIQTFQRALSTNDQLAVFDIMQYYFPGWKNPERLKESINKYLPK